MFTPTGSIVGIDAFKSHLDLALPQRHESWRFDNDLEGIHALAELLQEDDPALIVLEATGGYEQAAFRHVSQCFPVAIVNTRRVRAFARANGRLATPALAGGTRGTDRIDAHNLAHFAQVVQPYPKPASTEAHLQLAGMMARRRQSKILVLFQSYTSC
jgi:transposase